MPDECENCGERKVEGRLNCPKCGHGYEDDGRDLETDPDRQG